MVKRSEDLNLIQSLQTLACFAIAKQLWSQPEIKKKIDARLKAAQYGRDDSCISRLLSQLLDNVQDLAKHIYPIVPIFFKRSISEVISFIGEDLFDWIIVSEKHKSGIIQQMTIWNIQLTPFHTIDRVRSGCISQNFNFANETLCQCCYEKYVEERWKKLEPKLKDKFERIFGKYKFHAIAFWKCYVHVVDYGIFQETIIVRNRQLFENYSPLENIFKVAVYCGYDAAVIYYWSQLTTQQKVCTINVLLSKKYSPVSIFEAWMDRWTNELITSKAQISTFIFVWNQLNDFYRRKLMMFSYWSVFIIIIRWRITDIYFYQIYNTWKPMFIAPRFYERTLRVAASNITRGDKHVKIFNQLWRPVANLYNDKTVAEFIWVSVRFQISLTQINTFLILQNYLTIYEDIDSATFIINKFEKRKKIEIMASLNQMLSVYNVNQKYHRRLQDFITTEILHYHQPEEVQIDVPEDEEEEPRMKKVSLLILFLIALIYLFFIFVYMVTPTSRGHEIKQY